MRREGFSLYLGIREYDEILRLQKRINSTHQENGIPDTVIFLEHYPCITIGRQGKNDHILKSRSWLKKKGIEVCKTDRGGDVTYHGPGQLVCYPILDLRNYNWDVLAYARLLEEVVIKTLQSFGIASGRKEKHPGVWVNDHRKIAAQGISLTRWVTMHGLSLNVSTLMEHFSLIVPCGLSTFQVTSMEECLGVPVKMSAVFSEMNNNFIELFDIELKPVREEEIEVLLNHG